MAFGLNPLQSFGGGGAFAAAGAGQMGGFFGGGGGGCNPIQGLLGGLMRMLSQMLGQGQGQGHCHHHHGHHGFPMGQQANFGQGPNAFAQAGPGFAQAGAGGSFAQAGIGPNGPYAFAGAANGLQNFLA